MKSVPATLCIALPAIVLIAGLSLLWQPALAQNATPHNVTTAQQEPAPSSGDQNAAAEAKTFMGKIVKTGDKLVLSDAESKTMYQLDDQQKAQEYLNKKVKVTGVLDASTGVIRVSAIEPA